MALHNDVIGEIKERLDIVEVITSYVPLEKSGRRFRALCPFHADKNTPSLIVFPDDQRWYCFGACNQGGDVVDFVMKREGWDFGTALEELARRAGVELRPLTPEQQEQRSYEDALGVVAGYFAGQLQQTPAALSYAHGRAWSDDVIRDEGLGYARGGSLPDLGNARAQRAAEALNRWAGKTGGAIVYVHRDGGRVVYLAGRAIEGKWHYNPPSDLAGPRRPYLNGSYSARAEELIIVEGQADAVTLGGWGVPALALAGSGVTGDLIERLGRHIEKRATIYVIPDADGKTDVAGLAEDVGPLLRVVTLPEGVSDVNDWAQQGGKAKDLRALLDDVRTWLELEIERVAGVNGRERTEARRGLFEHLAGLDAFALNDYREKVISGLRIGAEEFNRYLRAVQAEAADGWRNGYDGDRYVVEGGRLCMVGFSRSGEQYTRPLCNFTAEIVEDVAHDDGEEITRQFTVTGRMENGHPLPRIRVDASRFMGMGWVNEQWGIQAVVRAGLSTRDQLREAIQLRSQQAQGYYAYTHTGWREIGGRRVYLHAGGAVGLDGVAVELGREVERYRLPPQPEDVTEAVRASLRFLEVAPDTITVPLWAAVHLAPLAEIVYPDFVTWLYGVTGTLKSTLAALALCHYGRFAARNLPATWADTANRLEKACFLAKDVPLVVDDFAPQSDPYRAREMEQAATRIVRSVGNCSGRGRLASDLSLRTVYRPRGLVISTGEQVPDGQSITARMYTVELRPGDVDLERLSAAQGEAGRYPHALVGYLSWVAGQWSHLAEELPRAQLAQRAQLLDEMAGQHLRIPDVLATLYLGLDVGLAHAVEVGALTGAQAQEWRERGWEALKAGAEAQARRIEQERPTVRFLEVLGDLLAQGRVRLKRARSEQSMGGGEDVGWYDDDYIYLLSDSSYNVIARFLRDEGSHFPVKERALHKALVEEGYLVRGSEDRFTDRYWDGERRYRVLKLLRTRVGEQVDALAHTETGLADQKEGGEGVPF